MLVTAPVHRCFVALCSVIFCMQALGCAGAGQRDDEAMAEIERLRAAVRQSEERVEAMRVQQIELSQQLRLLTEFVGVMANEAAARRAATNAPKEGLAGNLPRPPNAPIERPKQPQSPDLEF